MLLYQVTHRTKWLAVQTVKQAPRRFRSPLLRRLNNLNAGVEAASYLVFDEFYLFDPVSTLPTTLEMLKMLH